LILSSYQLGRRVVEPEIMDDADLPEEHHHAALEGLARLNRVGGSARFLWKPIRRLAGRLGKKRLRVLDIATGGGDVPIGLWRKAHRNGLQLDICGVDVSPRAVRFARQQAERCGADVSFETADALTDGLPKGYDVIVSSLFLHHLDEVHAEKLLRVMASAARHLVLVNDLVRHGFNLLMVQLAARLITRCDVVHVDGARSVKAAFTRKEALRLAETAGLDGASVTLCFPCRFLLTWSRPQ
jgi:2-polyprenyl-3-methyl-5-hydroxy-6-metoxy-1,4-benzoquinol methylase